MAAAIVLLASSLAVNYSEIVQPSTQYFFAYATPGSPDIIVTNDINYHYTVYVFVEQELEAKVQVIILESTCSLIDLLELPPSRRTQSVLLNQTKNYAEQADAIYVVMSYSYTRRTMFTSQHSSFSFKIFRESGYLFDEIDRFNLDW